ncbi:hypothetical protein DCAR_0933767 [Daucus carota subsp. sativus]|uniref:Hexosyltransferase n=1 Tax=Daucus carota subsp. sativus TaxID=79200 RepID=A0A175YDL3_DAUCS|nr:hypothetical protein DCAR_0933767 [Daucus carota subsp. sativus]
MPKAYFYAVKDCFCEKTWSDSPQYKIGYCQQCPNKVQWPANLGPKPPLYFNAGMFVYEPSLSIYDDLLSSVKTTPPTSFAEQDFLNMFFRDGYKPIPSDYNLVHRIEEENMDRKDIKKLVKMWWDIYDDKSLDYKPTTISAPIVAAAEVDHEGIAELLAALSKSGIVKIISTPPAA